MTDGTRALVAQLRETLGYIVQYDDVGLMQTNATIELARTAIAAADQWLESPPTNQCGETCERAKLCATCARGLGHPSLPPQVPNEHGHLLTTAALWDMHIEEPVALGTTPGARER